MKIDKFNKQANNYLKILTCILQFSTSFVLILTDTKIMIVLGPELAIQLTYYTCMSLPDAYLADRVNWTITSNKEKVCLANLHNISYAAFY